MWSKVASLFLCIIAVRTQDSVTCGRGKRKYDVTLGAGDSVAYSTQEGAMYGGNVRCTVNFQKDASCAEMSFSCSEFSTQNKVRTCRSSADYMRITTDEESKKFCKTNSPDVTTAGDTMTVQFISSRKWHQTGAQCTAICSAEATEAPTTAPPTEGMYTRLKNIQTINISLSFFLSYPTLFSISIS